MLWALIDNEKVEPSPSLKGICPACNGRLIAKCGEINTWHWAHHKSENCDSWYEPETDWHLNWKKTFGKKNSEIVIKKGDKWHIADILTKSNVVIELQNSPIKKEVIKQREYFYGDRLIWIINGLKFISNFTSGGKFMPNYLRDGHGEDLYDGSLGNSIFYWGWPRRSWQEAKRYVFIDFGDDRLYWIRNGMGTSEGIFTVLPKEKFILKYGGDYQYFKSLFKSQQ